VRPPQRSPEPGPAGLTEVGTSDRPRFPSGPQASPLPTPEWPFSCTLTPLDGQGSQAAGICKMWHHKQMPVLKVALPSRAFQQFPAF
jgi:hypothetical protein